MAALLGACSMQSDPRSQLERLNGIPVEEAGRYTDAQLALMKTVRESDLYDHSDKEHVIQLIKDGTLPRFQLSL